MRNNVSSVREKATFAAYSNIKNDVVMKKYRFILKVASREWGFAECELSNLQEATLRAESYLDRNADNFIDSVSFFEVKEGYTYQLVYRIEKCHELSESYGL